MICFTISYYLVKKNNIYFIFRYIYLFKYISKHVTSNALQGIEQKGIFAWVGRGEGVPTLF